MLEVLGAIAVAGWASSWLVTADAVAALSRVVEDRPEACCPRCGYSTTGLRTGDACPECGLPGVGAAASGTARSRRRNHWAIIDAVLICGAFSALSLAGVTLMVGPVPRLPLLAVVVAWTFLVAPYALTAFVLRGATAGLKRGVAAVVLVAACLSVLLGSAATVFAAELLGADAVTAGWLCFAAPLLGMPFMGIGVIIAMQALDATDRSRS